MSPTLEAFLYSWPFDPWLLGSLLLCAAIYTRGWLVLYRRAPQQWPTSRLVLFVAGLTTIYLALASPIEPFSGLLLAVHMIQHMLLMMVAPPLLWLGMPLLPMIRGIPRPIRIYWVAPLFHLRWVRNICRRFTHPIVAFCIYVGTTWIWHAPAIYESALRSSVLHYLQHICFLGGAILFWYPIVQPYPSHSRWSRWLLFPYLLLTDVQNTVFAALLTFSDRVIYPHYTRVPRISGISALDDQSVAGVIMWVPGSVAFLAPLFAIGLQLLYGESVGRKSLASRRLVEGSRLLPVLDSEPIACATHDRFDLLCAPLLGRFLRWRHARLVMQIPLLILAGAVVVDGIGGPQVGAMNLAGVLPWTHWRGILVLGLLAVGNVSCMACPFTVPRIIARRWLPAAHRPWPRALRGKWPAVALLILFLWAYEAFALWDRPRWTAGIIIGYFLAALLVDSLYRGGSFCKHVCPIGQFNFVHAQLSPLEVGVRRVEVCTRCTTHDCISGRDHLPGCELSLFQPKKVGNLDCTFCLDCVHACPHENVGIQVGVPGRDLAADSWRSGIGRTSQRPDLAVLTLILVFGAFSNAAGMVGPVLESQAWLSRQLGSLSPLLVTSGYYLGSLIVVPLLVYGTATIMSRRMGRLIPSCQEVAARYAQTLVPLGFGMWLAHYSFHFLTSYGSIVPTTQRFFTDFGWSSLGEPEWSLACCRPVSNWLLHLEIVFLDLGLLGSLYCSYQVSRDLASGPSQALKSFAPWAILIILLFAAGVWIVFQPMQMRGALPIAG